MSSSYNFEGGTYDPVEGTNVLPEMEADYARIERSENEFFDSLRENDRNRANAVSYTHLTLPTSR